MSRREYFELGFRRGERFGSCFQALLQGDDLFVFYGQRLKGSSELERFLKYHDR